MPSSTSAIEKSSRPRGMVIRTIGISSSLTPSAVVTRAQTSSAEDARRDVTVN